MLRMMHPKQHAPISDAILLQATQVCWKILDRLAQDFWMSAQPLELLRHLLCGTSIETFEGSIEGRGGVKLVDHLTLLTGRKRKGTRLSCEMLATCSAKGFDKRGLGREQVVFELVMKGFKCG